MVPAKKTELDEGLLAGIVGADNVVRNPVALDEYGRDKSFVNAIRPMCVVKPKNAEEIQKIVQMARQTLTPLVPVSSGLPHFRGDTVPGTGGAVVVDLNNMKEIIRVDRENRVAMFEPGVTFNSLISAVSAKGLQLASGRGRGQKSDLVRSLRTLRVPDPGAAGGQKTRKNQEQQPSSHRRPILLKEGPASPP